MDREQAHQLVDKLFDALPATDNQPAAEPATRELPSDKRVVRTKSSGDRVYLLDDVKKTRQWLTNPAVLRDQGFEASDVTEIDDAELAKYILGAAIYRVEHGEA